MSKDFVKRFLVAASKTSAHSDIRSITTSRYLSGIETEELIKQNHKQESKKNNSLTPSSTPSSSSKKGDESHKRR